MEKAHRMLVADVEWRAAERVAALRSCMSPCDEDIMGEVLRSVDDLHSDRRGYAIGPALRAPHLRSPGSENEHLSGTDRRVGARHCGGSRRFRMATTSRAGPSSTSASCRVLCAVCAACVRE